MKFRDKFKCFVYTLSVFYILLSVQVLAKGKFLKNKSSKFSNVHRSGTFSDAQEWKGKWFPKRPDESLPILDPNMINDDMISSNMIRTNRIKTMGISDPDCDDAEVNFGCFFLTALNKLI